MSCEKAEIPASEKFQAVKLKASATDKATTFIENADAF